MKTEVDHAYEAWKVAKATGDQSKIDAAKAAWEAALDHEEANGGFVYDGPFFIKR